MYEVEEKPFLSGKDLEFIYEGIKQGDRILLGEEYNRIEAQIRLMIRYHWKRGIKEGVKGYLFFGPPGTGKTLTAFFIAYRIGALPNRTFYIDVGNIAAKYFGDPEKRLRRVFLEGKNLGRVIYIFDDAESAFFSRRLAKEAWQYSLVAVMLHEIDKIDTSKEALIMTTNMPELLDPAIKDRLYPVVFIPSLKTLIKYIDWRLEQLGIPEIREEIVEKVKVMYEDVKEDLKNIENNPEILLYDETGDVSRLLREKMPSIRRIEKMIIAKFAMNIIKKEA